MVVQRKDEAALSGIRVLDLTERGCLIAGKILGDLGADVIKVERPGGDPSRKIAPFHKDIPHPERSLFWMAYNLNKRGITLNLETANGKETFKRLVAVSDFVIESFAPGYLERLGLGYEALSKVNHHLILTSITPFGQNGPKSHYKFSELTSWASHGSLYATGYPGLPPVAMSFPFQGSLVGAVDAVVGSLFALWYREATGQGQHVDVSLQETNIELLQALIELWDTAGYNYVRTGTVFRIHGRPVTRNMVFTCKDGYVAFSVLGGAEGVAKSTMAMVRWMNEEGMVPDWLKEYDFAHDYDSSKLAQEESDRLDRLFAEFLLTKTKAELFERSLREGIMLAPVDNTADLAQNPQLTSRDFWVQLGHPELGETLTYCGPFAKFSETPCTFNRRAPLIGEHNEEVYIGLLGMSKTKLLKLKETGVI